MPQIGKITEFSEGKESFANYKERLEQFLEANEVADEKNFAVFLSVIGPSAYGVLKNLTSPALPKDKTYDVLVTTLQNHFMPKPLVISERFKFNKRNQREGESVSAYVVELRKLATHCEFGTFLNEALRDRLVCGLCADIIQKKLLSTDALTFDEAIKIAVAMETADKDTVSFSHSVKNVSFVKGKKPKPQNKSQGPPKYEKNINKYPVGQKHRDCYRCGEKHHPDSCKHKNAKCFNCSQTGHLARKCRKQKASNYVEAQDKSESDDEQGIYFVLSNTGGQSDCYKVPITINDEEIFMELDTGSGCTLINEETYMKTFRNCKLKPTKVTLKGYSGEKIQTLGELEVQVRTGNQKEQKLRLMVVKGKKTNLLGRDWLKSIRLDWRRIFDVHHVSEQKSLENLQTEYQDLFVKDGKPIKGFKASIKMRENANPIFQKARPVPYALKDKITEELKKLEADGIIERVETCQWATPLVVVPKPNNKLRLCGDYKVTVNRGISEEQYPIPNTEDMFATLAGGQKFTKLDLSQAYTQLELEENSKECLTLNTHLGLFRVNRLAYGVSSAPAIFQAVMDTVLAGLPRIVCRIDDILITESNDEKHLVTLEEVLSRLRRHNIKLNKDKCEFMAEKVVYMGHLVDSEGIHTTEEKTKAVRDAPVPTNVSQLKSYLGLINYYGAFLPNLSTLLHPLHRLLRKEVKWCWSKDCEEAFEASKKLLTSSQLLVHYDMDKELRLACDASSYGLEAVISHVMEDGSERPIAFASRTLAPAEKNYAQVEKEALGLVFGVKKFHKYLYGRKFTLHTDHQALTTIFGPRKGVPPLAAARLQRWAIILSAYTYDIQYRRSANHASCDGLSRLPIKEESINKIVESVSFIEELPVTSKRIAEATRKSPTLSRVLEYTQSGWPNYIEDKKLKPYFRRRLELSTDGGIVLWGLRVVVPERLHSAILSELHSEHLGMCRMKTLARSYVWWPGLDAHIETVAKQCGTCQSLRNLPPETPRHPWRWTSRPMERVHVDFADFKGQSYLILIDNYSKWLEVVPMKSTTSEKTIEKLRGIFASTGLPEELVSDNGPQFKAAEFSQFMSKNGIKHTLTPPYHPSSNGQVERAVQIVKKALKGRLSDNQQRAVPRSLHCMLADFLLKYRVTPHTITGVPPCDLFMKRQLRSRLSLLRPAKDKAVKEKQESMKQYHDKSSVQMRQFSVGDKVAVKTNTTVNKWKWVPGVIQKVLGTLTYMVRCNQKLRFCHADHLVECRSELPPESVEKEGVDVDVQLPRHPTPEVTKPIDQPVIPAAGDEVNQGPSVPPSDPKSIVKSTPQPPSVRAESSERRYPARARKAPDRLDL